MKKSKLNQLPIWEKIEDLYEFVSGDYLRTITSVQYNDQIDGEVLIFNIYGIRNGIIKPQYRVFQKKDSYCTWDYMDGKWKTGALRNLREWNWSSCWISRNNLFVDVEQEAMADRLLSSWMLPSEAKTVVDKFHELQKQILEDKLMERHKKEIEEIDADMSRFGKLPDNYQDFVENTVFSDSNYLFYSKRKKFAYCSRCGAEFEPDKNARHNEYADCPACMTNLQFKSLGYSKENLSAIKWSVLVQPDKENVLVRYFRHFKSFKEDYRNPKIETSEQFRTVHSANASKDYEWNTFKQTNITRWVNAKFNYPYYWTPSEWLLPKSVILYNDNIEEAVKGTDFKYSCLGEYLKSTTNCNPWIIDKYLNSYRKNPWFEQLIKVGLTSMVDEYKEGRTRLKVESGRTILQTLGISKDAYKLLVTSHKNWTFVEYQRFANAAIKRDLTEQEYNFVRHNYPHYREAIDMLEYTTSKKMNNYFSRNCKAVDWFDYIGWCMKLNLNMRNEFTLYPRNFQETHDRRYTEYLQKEDPAKYEEIQNVNRMLEQLRKDMKEDSAMNMKAGGLFIRLPNNLMELTAEGENLHHCVGTYKDRVAKGKTMIFFIRKTDRPDESYYTLEWKDDKVIQCRGMRNCDMTTEVKAFVQIFTEKMHKQNLRKAM